jgi:hypothetical protein
MDDEERQMRGHLIQGYAQLPVTSVLLACVLLAASAGTASAAEQASEAGAKLGFTVGADFEFGGDEVANRDLRR